MSESNIIKDFKSIAANEINKMLQEKTFEVTCPKCNSVISVTLETKSCPNCDTAIDLAVDIEGL